MKAVKTLCVAGGLMLVAGTAMAEIDGAAIFNGGCAACHATGVAGAPKVGDKAAWAERVAQDRETTYGHAINGFQGKSGVMPPKGGFTNLSDDEIKAAVDYMIKSSQ